MVTSDIGRNIFSHFDFNEEDDEDEEYDFPHLKTIEKILEEGEEEEKEKEKEEQDKDEIWRRYANKPSKYKLITRRIDSNRIRHKTVKNIEIITSSCKSIKIEEDGPVRSGAIIYTHWKGKTYFCMGIDSAYGDLTDFAGGVKKEESIVEGGLRELEEESLGIFGKLTPNQVADCLAFYCTNMVIMFIKFDLDIEKTKIDFSNKLTRKFGSPPYTTDALEVSDIYWLDTTEFLESISGKGRRMYSRVRKILSKVTEIISAL